MSAGKYFHELPKEERDKIMSSSITVGEFVKTYQQPDWCNYPEALNGHMGCWSLVYHTDKISKSFCSDCDCCVSAKV